MSLKCFQAQIISEYLSSFFPKHMSLEILKSNFIIYIILFTLLEKIDSSVFPVMWV